MKSIVIDFIPHSKQRYNTCGDWTFNDDVGDGSYLVISVSETPEWRYSAPIAVHELVEALLCKHANITTKQVDKFDLNWTPHDGITEPGNDPKAPYHRQHKIAEKIEKVICKEFEINWSDYKDLL